MPRNGFQKFLGVKNLKPNITNLCVLLHLSKFVVEPCRTRLKLPGGWGGIFAMLAYELVSNG